MIVEGIFDPITSEEIREIRRIAKERNSRDIFLKVSEEGILSKSDREKLVQAAVRPYRHMHVTDQGSADFVLTGFETEEAKARSGYFRLVPKGARRILITENMYLEQIADALCTPKRAAHSRRVADTCAILAKAHGLDEKTALRMGYLHDITKAMSDEEGRKILEVWQKEDLELSPPIWHSHTAVIFLKQNMGLYDHTVLSAIWNHTLGGGRSDYDRILYIADKIEPGRGYDTSYHMALAKKDLPACVELVRKEGEEYRKKEK